jgi:ABC-type branched-subunit amino acid transport system substrate-binding protein
MPISGALGFLGEAGLAGLRAYFGMTNASGGVRGRQYQLIVVDTQFEPTVEAVAAKRLVDQDKVFALYGVIADSSAAYVTSRGIPEMALGVAPPIFSSRYPNIYPLCCNAAEMVAQWAHHLTQVLKLPIKSIGLLYDSQNIPVQQWLPYMTKAWELWGVQVKTVDRFNLSDGDCTALVIKARNLNIDYWDIGESAGWPLCEQAMGRQGWHPPLGRGGVETPDAYFVAQAGATADGVFAQNFGPQIAQNLGEPYPWDPSGKAPEVQRYLDSAKRYSPNNTDIRSLESAWMQLYWSGGKLLDEAIKAQPGAITWQGVNGWLQSQRAWHSGLTSPLNFDPKCKSGVNGWVFQWKWNGKEMEQADWRKYGGHWNMPTDAKNKIISGAGDCLATALADAVIK